MQRCDHCKLEKLLESFHFRNRARNERMSTCITCCKERRTTWLKSLDGKISTHKGNQYRATRNKEYINNYLKDHFCVDCGYSNPLALQFDHVRGTKTSKISLLVTRGGISKLKLEIDKCEVRCANCHVIRHRLQSGPRPGQPVVSMSA